MYYFGSIPYVEKTFHNSWILKEVSWRYVQKLDAEVEGLFKFYEDALWALIADKGFLGAFDLHHILYSIRVPISGFLTANQRKDSRKVFSDRITVEKDFRRMTSLCSVLHKVFARMN